LCLTLKDFRIGRVGTERTGEIGAGLELSEKLSIETESELEPKEGGNMTAESGIGVGRTRLC
jgi:hypothetical protein